MHIQPSHPQTPISGSNTSVTTQATPAKFIASSTNMLAEKGKEFLNYLLKESHKFFPQDEDQQNFLVEVMNEINITQTQFKELQKAGGTLTERQEKFIDDFEFVEGNLITHILPPIDEAAAKKMMEDALIQKENAIRDKIDRLQQSRFRTLP